MFKRVHYRAFQTEYMGSWIWNQLTRQFI